MANKATAQRVVNIVYDVFTAIVSLLDVITDLMVMYEFYLHGRMTFFYISLTILVVAQFAYCIAFWFKFESSYESFGGAVAAFCCLLPFAPILSFAFYFTANSDSCLYQSLSSLYTDCRCNVDIHSGGSSGDAELTAFKDWMQSKLSKHMGFIIEAMVEAFPQSILQLVAIVYFNDTDNYISMISILLSMISVSTKSFILSVSVSYNWKSMLFNWFCAICDFWTIFFIVSFAFYVPPNLADFGHVNPFELISQVWIYSIVITVCPFAVIGSVGMNMYVCYKVLRGGLNICMILFVQLAWCVGLCITIMAMTIACFLILAAVMLQIGLYTRIPYNYAQKFYFSLIRWYRQAGRIRIQENDASLSISISARQHRVIRMCCINQVMLDTINNSHASSRDAWKHNTYDSTLHAYLKEKATLQHASDNHAFFDVTLQDIKRNTDKYKGDKADNEKRCESAIKTWNKIRDKLDDRFERILMLSYCRWIVINICTPLYVLGRVMYLFFGLFIVLYLIFGHNVHVFSDDVPLFQTSMFVAYTVLLLLWAISFVLVLTEQRDASYLLPSSQRLFSNNDLPRLERKKQEIIEYYDSIMVTPYAKKCCLKRFGNDITLVIMDYYGVGQQLDEDEDMDVNYVTEHTKLTLSKAKRHTLV